VEQFESIRRDHREEEVSIRELARRHGVHRRAVRQALACAVHHHASPSSRGLNRRSEPTRRRSGPGSPPTPMHLESSATRPGGSGSASSTSATPTWPSPPSAAMSASAAAN